MGMDTDFKMFCLLELKLPFYFFLMYFSFLGAAGKHAIVPSLYSS